MQVLLFGGMRVREARLVVAKAQVVGISDVPGAW